MKPQWDDVRKLIRAAEYRGEITQDDMGDALAALSRQRQWQEDGKIIEPVNHRRALNGELVLGRLLRRV